MEIKILKLGPLETNCYLLKNNNKILIIDPADQANEIIKEIGKNQLVGILITHNHFDHVGALSDLKNYYDVDIYNKDNLQEKQYNINGFIFKVVFNPGHTDDSISFYFEEEEIMFVGDFIFKDSIGRTDLGGNMNDMLNSIRKIKNYGNIILYPGHGTKTTLDYEKKNNYYFNM